MDADSAFFFGALIAAGLLLAVAWHGFLRRRLPGELWGATILAAALLVGAGFVISRRWRLSGELLKESRVSAPSARRAVDLLVSSTYLRAIDLDPELAAFLRRGLIVSSANDSTALRFDYGGFAWSRPDPRKTAAVLFATEAARDAPDVLFAAQLLAARTTDDIADLILKRRRPLGRTARYLIREHVAELEDRFPDASALLAELRGKAGG